MAMLGGGSGAALDNNEPFNPGYGAPIRRMQNIMVKVIKRRILVTDRSTGKVDSLVNEQSNQLELVRTCKLILRLFLF